MTKTYRFSVSTGYVHSERAEDVTLEFADDATPDQIEAIVDEEYQMWLWENINTHYAEV